MAFWINASGYNTVDSIEVRSVWFDGFDMYLFVYLLFCLGSLREGAYKSECYSYETRALHNLPLLAHRADKEKFIILM